MFRLIYVLCQKNVAENCHENILYIAEHLPLLRNSAECSQQSHDNVLITVAIFEVTRPAKQIRLDIKLNQIRCSIKLNVISDLRMSTIFLDNYRTIFFISAQFYLSSFLFPSPSSPLLFFSILLSSFLFFSILLSSACNYHLFSSFLYTFYSHLLISNLLSDYL